MSRWGTCVFACLTACAPTEFSRSPEPFGTQSYLFVFVESGGARQLLATRVGTSVHLTESEGDSFLLTYDAPLEALRIEAGPVFEDLRGNNRGLPLPSSIYRRTALDWAVENEAPLVLRNIRIPEASPNDCAAMGGCFPGDWTDLEGRPMCLTPCPTSVGTATAARPRKVALDCIEGWSHIDHGTFSTCEPPAAATSTTCTSGEVPTMSGACQALETDCADHSDDSWIFVEHGRVGGNGSRANPFGTLAAALVDARAAGSATIALSPGEYRERAVLGPEVAALSLIGACGGTTSIVSPSASPTVDATGVYLSLSNLSIGRSSMGRSVHHVGGTLNIRSSRLRGQLTIRNAGFDVRRMIAEEDTVLAVILSNAQGHMEQVYIRGRDDHALWLDRGTQATIVGAVLEAVSEKHALVVHASTVAIDRARLEGGSGAHVGPGSFVDARNLLVANGRHAWSTEVGGRSKADGFVVRDMSGALACRGNTTFGRGLFEDVGAAITAGSCTLRDSWIRRATFAAVLSQTTLTASNIVVTESGGFDLNEATLDIDGLIMSGVERGLSAVRSTINISHGQLLGQGATASLWLEDSEVHVAQSALDGWVTLTASAAAVHLSDVTITRSGPWRMLAASLDAKRLHIERVGDLGFDLDFRSTLNGQHLLINGPSPREAMRILRGGLATLTHFDITGSAGHAFRLESPAALTLQDGRIAGFGVAFQTRVEFDARRLLDRVLVEGGLVTSIDPM